jgi:hypothetical protein
VSCAAVSRDYVGEAAQAIAGRIRPEQTQPGVFGRPQPPTKPTPDKGIEAAKLALVQAQAEAEFKILKDALDRQARELDAALEDRLISLKDYYAAKTRIEQQEIDAEIQRAQASLAQQQRLVKTGKDEPTRIKAKSEVVKLEADLTVLNNKRADVDVANARKAVQAERELREELAKVRDELLDLTGAATSQDRRAAIERQYQSLIERLRAEGGIVGAVDLVMGNAADGQNDYLAAKLGANVPAFRGVVSLVLRQPQLSAMNPYIKPWSAELTRIIRRSDGSPQWYSDKAAIAGDMNPAHIIYECLTDRTWGRGYSSAEIDDVSFRAAADTLYAENFGLSILWDQQQDIEAFIERILQHIDGSIYVSPRTGLFTLKLIRQRPPTRSVGQSRMFVHRTGHASRSRVQSDRGCNHTECSCREEWLWRKQASNHRMVHTPCLLRVHLAQGASCSRRWLINCRAVPVTGSVKAIARASSCKGSA